MPSRTMRALLHKRSVENKCRSMKKVLLPPSTQARSCCSRGAQEGAGGLGKGNDSSFIQFFDCLKVLIALNFGEGSAVTCYFGNAILRGVSVLSPEFISPFCI